MEERRRHALILATCSLSLFLTSLDGTIVNVALPAIQRGLHTQIAGLEWVVDSYLLVLATLLLVSGATGDRIGRRRMFGTGLMIFIAGSLLCSLAPSIELLIAFRMVQAVGGSMLVPNSLSIITNTFTDARRRAMAIGVWAGVFGVSAASGPVIGGLLVVGVGWRAVFWVTAPVGALALFLSRRYLPESRAPHPRPIDVPGQLLMAACLALVTYAIIEGPTTGWSSPRTLALFGASAVLLASFVAVERRAAAPMLNLRFFRSPPFSGAVGIAVACSCMFAGFLFLSTLYLQDSRRLSALMAGVAMLPATAVIAAVAPLSGRLVARWGSRPPLVAAGTLITAAAVILLQTNVTTPFWELAVAYLVLGAGFGLANPPITNTAVSGMPRAQAGTAAGMASAARQVGSVLGVALMGALTTSRYLASIQDHLVRAGVPPGLRRVLVAAGPAVAARPVPGRGLTDRAAAVVRATFAVSAHAGWELAVVCGVIVVVTALVTTGTRGRAAAVEVGRVMELEEGAASGAPVVSAPLVAPGAAPAHPPADLAATRPATSDIDQRER
ncbi:MAG: MFS transporter [Acidimicrobiales bacterium]